VPDAGRPGRGEQVVHGLPEEGGRGGVEGLRVRQVDHHVGPLQRLGQACPLSRSTPVDSECGTASCPLAFRILTTCDPMSLVPPMTAICKFVASQSADVKE
jgi:hypothetical protein